MSAKKKTAAKKRTSKAQPAASKASWLVGRFRNALHNTRPALKKAGTLKGVSTLSELKAALAVAREEWEGLLESFFSLGGKLV